MRAKLAEEKALLEDEEMKAKLAEQEEQERMARFDEEELAKEQAIRESVA